MRRQLTIRALRIRRKGRNVRITAGPKVLAITFGRKADPAPTPALEATRPEIPPGDAATSADAPR